MCEPSAFEWQGQKKKRRQQRGSNGRKLLNFKILPAGQAAGSKHTWNFSTTVRCDTFQVRKAFGLLAPKNVDTYLLKSLEAYHTTFC